jgi:hypothetical protein
MACGHFDAELLQLAVDAWRAPERVRIAHLANQCPEVRCQLGPTDAGSRLSSANRQRTRDDANARPWPASRSALLAASSARRLRATPRPGD